MDRRAVFHAVDPNESVHSTETASRRISANRQKVLGSKFLSPGQQIVVSKDPCLGLGWILFGCERIDFVGNPIIFDQDGKECSSKQQGPAIFAPRGKRELQGDIHKVRRTEADIRQESENDEDDQCGMRVTGRDAQ